MSLFVHFLICETYSTLSHALAVRHLRYNETMEYIEPADKDGRIFVIRPPEALHIDAGEKDPAELERVYQIGRKEGARCLEGVAIFLGTNTHLSFHR